MAAASVATEGVRKRGGARTPEHKTAFLVGGIRAQARKKKRVAQLSSGRSEPRLPQRAHVDCTPAVWLPATQHVGDCQYVDDPVDEVLLRALRERLVYAGSCCHREPVFQDITVAVIAAADKEFRKNGVRAPRGLPKKKTETIPEYIKRKAPDLYREMAKKPEKPASYREGKPLTEVVAEMFDT